jgi:hypothetical protein
MGAVEQKNRPIVRQTVVTTVATRVLADSGTVNREVRPG